MAEINFNNLYDQLGLLDQKFYDSTFKNTYDPNKSQPTLEMKPAYDQMKAVYEAEQQVPEKSIFDIFSSASAAEPDRISSVSGTPGFKTVANPDGTISIVPINQQQGIMVPAYETSQLDLVNQINQGPRNIGVPMNLEETMAGSVLPPDPRRFQSIFPTTGIMQQAPQTVKDTIASNLLYEDLPSGIDTSYGVANEEDVEEEIKKKGGIAEFLKTILGFAIPGANLFMGDRSALEGIKSLNQRLRNTDFGRSKTLADYFDAKSYGGRDERDAAAARTMAQARGLQKQIDQRQSAVQTNQDRGRGDKPGGANYSAPSKPSRASSYRDSSSFGKSFHGG